MSKEVKIMLGIAAIILIGGVFLLVHTGGKAPSDLTKGDHRLVESDSNMTGKAGAKVEMVEFGDYECPACGYYYPILKQVTDQYKDNPDFNFVFRNFPLTSIHPNAMIGAEAAEAAGAQGKYWEMHDMLYEKQSDWGDSKNPIDLFVTYAQSLGLDVDRFKSEVQSNKYADKINADENDGLSLNVDATPTIFINGKQLSTIPSADDLKKQIDDLLK